ncbi:MAG: rod shape-determining protein RodA [Spirochaetales bacterium]|nr:MAG: rod shape-determining protein RodA [Spirochaetales bacterium]
MISNDNSPKTFLRLDIVLILTVLGLLGLGIAFIYSSGVNSNGVQVSREWIRQIIWAVTGMALMTVTALLDYRHWKQWALAYYLIVLFLLVLVLIVGNYIKGARAWLGVGSVGLQPSEFGKLGLILVLAWWFDEWGSGGGQLRNLGGAAILTGIPVLLVLVQPDLGTAIVYIPIAWAMAFVSGLNWRLLVFPLLAGILIVAGVLGIARNEFIAATPSSFYRIFSDPHIVRILTASIILLLTLLIAGWLYFKKKIFAVFLYCYSILSTSYFGIIGASRLLRGYQMMRLVVFLEPQIDPKGAGWHIIQSVTAVGSGGFVGKGFLRGTQSHYRFLPEQSTDFIFSIIAEEMGFIGSLVVFGLFSIIIFRALYTAYTSQDRFGTYLAVGIAAMVSFHVIQNIGMAIGVMPITGIPLFFLSYGGSSLWMVMMSMGLLLSIHYRRHK